MPGVILDRYILAARKAGASDLHLEPGLTPAFRVRGDMVRIGSTVEASTTESVARELLDDSQWTDFLEHQSADVGFASSGVRCRANLFRTMRGIGAAIRILPGTMPSIRTLNLHPDVKDLVESGHGLVVVSGATGSGKSSTLAALINMINTSRSEHIVTVEQPIEFVFEADRCFIRQREVGRDTPSFARAAIDALREDPDVLMIGEMRDPETIRLTLTAAETGHLVLTTLHASSSEEAVERIVSAFAPEIQAGVRAQLAGCLVGIVIQRLVYDEKLKLRVPELEILRATSAVRNVIRQGQFFKLASLLQTGAADGLWTVERYREWLSTKKDWSRPSPLVSYAQDVSRAPETEAPRPPLAEPPAGPEPAPPPRGGNVIDLDSPDETVEDILSEFRKR